MIGAAIQPLARPSSPSAAAANSPAASRASALSIHNVAEKLAVYAHSTQAIDVAFLLTHCISLARGIDSAIANNEIPAHVMELPKIFKQICQGVKEDTYTLQSALMVLLISVKNACKAYWFPNKETQELLDLVDEVGKNFCTPEGFNCEQTNVLPIVVRIISRYYPCIRLGHILAAVDIKPGFEACVVDFHISKNIAYSATEKIRMMVAMKDSIDTSACLITPQKVNFLLNGKGVQGRSSGCMDPRPQSPTSVNHMIKYGTNLLQAIGNFDAHYVVLIAFMSAVPHTDLSAPDYYVWPTTDAVNSDADIVRESSLVSLNCPISLARMRIPAKGRTCKHLQCFDLSNYIEMNSKRPSWKCPHCKRAVSFPETRIDQHMTKILKLAPKEVSDVIIHSDGSWEFARGNDNYKHELHAKAIEGPPERLDQQQAPRLTHICDLTGDDVDMTPVDALMHEDGTPKGASHLGYSGAAPKIGASSNPVGGISANLPSTSSLQQSQNARTISSPHGYATPNGASRKPTATPGHPQMHAPSPRASSSSVPASTGSTTRESVQQRQVPQSTRQAPAPQNSESQNQFNAPPRMEPPPFLPLQFPQLRAGIGLRFTKEELQTIRENARRARERATRPAHIQTLPPPIAPKPSSIPSRSVSAERPPTSGSQGAAQDTQPDESWRPAGRMRGSLAGRAADALGDVIIRPSTPAPAPPPERMSGADSISLSARTPHARRDSAEQPPTSSSQGAARDTQPDESWRPAGRMRGSLAGRAADALGDVIIRPSAPAPAPPPERMSGADSISLSARTPHARRDSGSQPIAPQKR